MYLFLLKLPRKKEPSELDNKVKDTLKELKAKKVTESRVWDLVSETFEIPGKGAIKYSRSTTGNDYPNAFKGKDPNSGKVEEIKKFTIAGTLDLIGFNESTKGYKKIEEKIKSGLSAYFHIKEFVPSFKANLAGRLAQNFVKNKKDKLDDNPNASIHDKIKLNEELSGVIERYQHKSIFGAIKEYFIPTIGEKHPKVSSDFYEKIRKGNLTLKGECHDPIFYPILINKNGKESMPKILEENYCIDSAIHYVYSIPKGCIVITSHRYPKGGFLSDDMSPYPTKMPRGERVSDLEIDTNLPTAEAFNSAKKLVKKISKKYKFNEFDLGEKPDSNDLPKWTSLNKYGPKLSSVM